MAAPEAMVIDRGAPGATVPAAPPPKKLGRPEGTGKNQKRQKELLASIPTLGTMWSPTGTRKRSRPSPSTADQKDDDDDDGPRARVSEPRVASPAPAPPPAPREAVANGAESKVINRLRAKTTDTFL